MFGKYLRKEHGFWRIKAENNQVCYCKHSPQYGGIYAYIEPGVNGVQIVTNGFTEFFNDFAKLGDFLSRIEAISEKNYNGLVRSLHLATASRSLRVMSL